MPSNLDPLPDPIYGSLVQTVAPLVEPVTVAQAKEHMRIDHEDEDALIKALIPTAREWAEAFARRQFITATYQLKFEDFPASDLLRVELLKGPIQSVTSVTYIATDGTPTVWSDAEYETDLDREPGLLKPLPAFTWPTVERDRFAGVTIEYISGFGPAGSSVPHPIRRAILMIVAELYERREDGIAGTTVTEVPFHAKALLWPKRKWRFR